MSYARIDLFGNGAVLIEDLRDLNQVNILLHKALFPLFQAGWYNSSLLYSLYCFLLHMYKDDIP